MQITFTLNHKKVTAEIAADTVLLDLVRSLGCKSVKLSLIHISEPTRRS